MPVTITLNERLVAQLQPKAKAEKLSLQEFAEKMLGQAIRTDQSYPIPEQVEALQMLALSVESDDEYQAASTSEDITEALAAVERLTSLFADVTINGLEQVLDDPMLELANSDLEVFA